MDEAKGLNPYFEGPFDGESAEVVALRLTLVKERDELRADLKKYKAHERVLPAARRIRTGLEAQTTEAAARNEASGHTYAWQRGSNPRALHPHTKQAPNAEVSG